jgi:hypothetical protein
VFDLTLWHVGVCPRNGGSVIRPALSFTYVLGSFTGRRTQVWLELASSAGREDNQNPGGRRGQKPIVL